MYGRRRHVLLCAGVPFAVIVAIDDNTEIDYGLIAPPAYDNVNFLETVHKVRVNDCFQTY